MSRTNTVDILGTLALLAAVALAPGAALPAQGEAASGLLPYKARYAVEWHGLNAGTTTIELTHSNNGHYSYTSGNQARGIFRLAFPDTIRQASILQVDSGMVRPLSYLADDGSKATDQDVKLDFDWDRNRVSGVAEDRPVALELKPGTQDPMSIQLLMILQLQAGQTPGVLWMVDKDQVKDFVYRREGEAVLATQLGTLPTVIWSSSRPDSDRVIRVWYAPSLGFTPLQAARTSGGKLEWTMTIKKLDRPTAR
jgi:hypothetical protein